MTQQAPEQNAFTLTDNEGNTACVQVNRPNNYQIEIKVEGFQTVCLDLFKHDRPILIIDGTDQDTTEHMIQLKNLDPE